MSNTIGKAELIARMTANTNMTAAQADVAYNALINAVTNEISNGNKVIIRGLGTFSVKTMAARVRTRPGTSERYTSEATKAVKFSVSERLRSAVRGK